MCLCNSIYCSLKEIFTDIVTLLSIVLFIILSNSLQTEKWPAKKVCSMQNLSAYGVYDEIRTGMLNTMI